jgi:hypothetical protein
MATSQNHWPALSADSAKLHSWVIPTRNGSVHLRLRNGSAGFILAHFTLWLAETVEPVFGGQLDDWAYAYRPVRGYETTLSNHSSGTAVDLNATKHPLGKRGTWGKGAAKIRHRLAWRLYGGCIRGGLDYANRADEMHFEINKPLPVCEKVAKRLARTPRGQRILAANPGQRQVIWS